MSFYRAETTRYVSSYFPPSSTIAVLSEVRAVSVRPKPESLMYPTSVPELHCPMPSFPKPRPRPLRMLLPGSSHISAGYLASSLRTTILTLSSSVACGCCTVLLISLHEALVPSSEPLSSCPPHPTLCKARNDRLNPSCPMPNQQ